MEPFLNRAAMSVITLLTDFGSENAYAGVMKGVILSIAPGAAIVDLTHGIGPQDLTQAAHELETAHRYFPPGSIHVIVVDPQVGTHRRIIAAWAGGQVFLAPDNGILPAVLDAGVVTRAVRVENRQFCLKPVSRTFHGRDIFAPVAAHLFNGIGPGRLGPDIPWPDLARLHLDAPYWTEDGVLAGMVIAVDRFGNLITNITETHLAAILAKGAGKKIEILLNRIPVGGFGQTYADAAPGDPLALVGSSGYLEIAVNRGSARRCLKARKGDGVRILTL
jgi:S-adenosyl-L-methionine hydrolase (adenosine-forming)